MANLMHCSTAAVTLIKSNVNVTFRIKLKKRKGMQEKESIMGVTENLCLMITPDAEQ